MAAIRRTSTFSVRCASQPFEFLFLQDAEKLGLKVQGDIANLVEKEAPVIGQLETAGFGRHRASECSPFVAEEFTLHEAGGDRRAIQLHKRTISARTPVVNQPRDELFPGSCFTHEQHGGVCLGDDLCLG